MITIGEGAASWEKYGHNSLWFVDSARFIDVAYNWGTFDFKEPGFAARFVAGTPEYWVERYPGRTILEYYPRADRTVEIQRLNFTPAQARKALERARWNALEENKRYLYDYFLDNCSTRVRDLIDYALDGALKRATEGTTVQRSYRSENLRLMDDLKLAQLGINVALGRPADRPLTVWADMFVPMRLRDAVRDVRIDGNALIADERVVYKTRANVEREDTPSYGLIYLVIGLVIAIDLFGLGIVGERSRAADIVFRAEAAAWSIVTGVLGAVVLFAWVATRHVFWANNENLLYLNPLSLWVGLLALMTLRNPRWDRPAAIAASVIALCGAAGLVAKGLPGAQDNLAIIALCFPANLAVAFGLWRRANRDAERGTRDATMPVSESRPA